MQNNFKQGILIAFGELFLKSDSVKKYFKQKLSDNLLFFIKKEKIDAKITVWRERIFIRTEDIEKTKNIVAKISGIVWFSSCIFFPKFDLKEIADFFDKNWQNWIKKNETFAIRLNFPGGDSRKIVDRLALNIDRKVNLDNPQKEIFIEIRDNGCFVYFEKEKGIGGLPYGSSGKVLALMSGGIDSPVAAYLALKRGAEPIWLHFHSFPLVSNKSIEKIKELANIFLGFQQKVKIYFIPFSSAQTTIRTKSPEGYRILLYRRLMLTIAEKIAEKENCKALLTGESMGQVSSQTLSNLKNIEEAVKIPVLRPLVVMDKEEIISLAKKINTYDVSIKPQEDCCTLFTPKHSNASADLSEIKKIEKKLGASKLIAKIFKEIKIVVI